MSEFIAPGWVPELSFDENMALRDKVRKAQETMEKKAIHAIEVPTDVERLTESSTQLKADQTPLHISLPVNPQIRRRPIGPRLPPPTKPSDFNHKLRGINAEVSSTSDTPESGAHLQTLHTGGAQVRTKAAQQLHTDMSAKFGKAAADFLLAAFTKAANPNAPVAGQQAIPRTGTRQARGTDIRTSGQHVGTRLPDGAKMIGNRKPVIPTPITTSLLNGIFPKTAAFAMLLKHGLQKQAVLAFVAASEDKKEALRTVAQILTLEKQSGLLQNQAQLQSAGNGVMPSGPDGPVPKVMNPKDEELAQRWFQRLDPISQRVPLARVMGRFKG